MTTDGWTSEQTAKLREYRAQGWGDTRCGAALGKSRHEVRHKWLRMQMGGGWLAEVAPLSETTAEGYAERIIGHWRKSVEGIIQAGLWLKQAKDDLDHGEFGRMIDDLLPFGARTVQKLMVISGDSRITNAKLVSYLPPAWGTLYELTRLDDNTFAAKLLDGTINPEMERADILSDAKQVGRAAIERELGMKQSILQVRKYGVIYADPPWRFEVYSRKTGLDRSPDNHYPTMTLDKILALPVANLAAPDCVLFLWVTAPTLVQALAALTAWEFDYKSHQVWVKDKVGTGYWFRNKHELLLVGVRGNPPAPAPSTRELSVIEAPRGEHSAKPEIFAEFIEGWYPTLPKIELFRRGPPRAEWDSWGNESESPPPTATNGSTSSAHSEARSLVAQSVGGGEHG